MGKRFTKKNAATSHMDAADLAKRKDAERQRFRARMRLLKRRRAKSHQ